MKTAIRKAIGASLARRNREIEHEMTLAALAYVSTGSVGAEVDLPDREPRPFRGQKPVRIHPEVLAATADELIASGWGWHERCLIPPDFKTTRPGKINATREKLGAVQSQEAPKGVGIRKKAETA